MDTCRAGGMCKVGCNETLLEVKGESFFLFLKKEKNKIKEKVFKG